MRGRYGTHAAAPGASLLAGCPTGEADLQAGTSLSESYQSQLPKVWMVQSFVETAKPHEVLDAMRVVSSCRVYIQTLQESIDVLW